MDASQPGSFVIYFANVEALNQAEVIWISNLKALLYEAGVSAKQVSREAGLGPSTVQRWLNGSCRPRSRNTRAIELILTARLNRTITLQYPITGSDRQDHLQTWRHQTMTESLTPAVEEWLDAYIDYLSEGSDRPPTFDGLTPGEREHALTLAETTSSLWGRRATPRETGLGFEEHLR